MLQRIMVKPADPSKMPIARVFEGFDFRQDASVGPARVFRTGRTEFYPHVQDELLVAVAVNDGLLALLRSFDLVSIVIVPLSVQDRVIGTITLGISQPHSPFTEEDRELAERLAQRAARAIENARLFRSVREELDRRERAEAGERLRVSALNRRSESDVIGIVTTEGNQIIEANDVFLRLVGYDAFDLAARGLNWWNLTPVEFHHLDMNAIAELLATGASTPYEKEYVRRDGTRVPVLIGAALLDREPFRWVCFVVDLSVRQAMEEAHQAFIEDVGHDLRNPMAVTRWAAQLMRRHLWAGQVDLEDLDHGLATIESSTARMELLLDDLMDAARLRLGQSIALNLEKVDLVELAESSVDSHRQSTDLHTIAFNTSERAIVGIWDPALLSRVLDNLLSNAIKYSLKGGRVDVSLERKSNSNGDMAVISVQDEGIGIPESELPTVFDRLRRGSEAAAEVPGLGIGLAGVKQIVEQHGGTITAESRVGEGSKFTVELPILTAPPS
jgi:PAS domain S-box-containing protein